VVLEVLPDRVPEPWEVEKLVQAIEKKNAGARVVMDLSRLDLIDSSMVARFVSMNRRIRGAGGHFVLTGLCEIVREIFDHLRLDKAFEIEGTTTKET
jgi:anti-anti-sigma factor